MATETDFSVEWLTTRYPFDVAARNKDVEQAALMGLPAERPIRLIDLGAGTGNNCRYFIPKLPQDQEWLLLELNPHLIAAAKSQLHAFAKEAGFKVTPTADGLYLAGRKKVTIRFREMSFLNLKEQLDLGSYDLVMAGAVIDLLTVNMLEMLVQQFIGHVVPFLATINFTGMQFEGATEQDQHYTKLYIQHMRRAQPFGRTLGAACIPFLKSWLLVRDIPFLSGASDWVISPTDRAMHELTLGFMQGAIPELLHTPNELNTFNQWLIEKKEQSDRRKLSFRVEHFDIYIP
ncbi:MAG: class I SAM-dependent methyltransferase [Bacteroidota bacterium]